MYANDVVDTICDTVDQSDIIHITSTKDETIFGIDFTGFTTDLMWIKHELDQKKEDNMFFSYDLECYKNGLEVYNDVDGFIE